MLLQFLLPDYFAAISTFSSLLTACKIKNDIMFAQHIHETVVIVEKNIDAEKKSYIIDKKNDFVT